MGNETYKTVKRLTRPLPKAIEAVTTVNRKCLQRNCLQVVQGALVRTMLNGLCGDIVAFELPTFLKVTPIKLLIL